MDKLFAARNAQLERIPSRSNVACILEEVLAFLWNYGPRNRALNRFPRACP